MAATINLYSTEVLNADGKIYLPLFLTEYGNTDNFLSAFFCDVALVMRDKENKQCILGAVRDGGYNADLRAEKRMSHIIVARKESEGLVKYRLLNDGGLNTKGQCAIICDYFFRNYNNLQYYGKASYYNDCVLTLKYKTANETNFSVVLTKDVGKKQEVIGTKNIMLGVDDTSPITLAVTMTNSEGDFTAEKVMEIKPAVTKAYIYKLNSINDYWDDGEVSLNYIYSTEYNNLYSASYPTAEEVEVGYAGVARFSNSLVNMYNNLYNLPDGYYAFDKDKGFKIENGGVIALFNPKQRPVAYPYIEFKVSMQYPYTAGTNTCRVNVSARYVVPTGATNPTATTTLSGSLTFCNSNGVGIAGGEWNGSSDFNLVVPIDKSSVSQQFYGIIEEMSGIVGAKPSIFSQNPTTYRVYKEYLDNSGNNIP